ncbi:hypothetical protein N9R04_03805 [Staphylococcus sp. SQ8-PEA]|uniref:Tetratricopeptide repeat protein n=1 Tax=Staphylococcus marylandisciuri TaxID=2981529 RepID=A0ABT2QPE5_9STAP|nr:tetratricopeptide repeat protein [Staphylococcus marylandisciuri]MCU5745846.1 hypothetical protein [Staphylococcus marylandisciuri]
MAQHNNVIPMTMDEGFYRKLANQKYLQQDYKKAVEYYRKVLEASPQDFEILNKLANSLTKLGLGNKAEELYFETIARDEFKEESFYELSQLNISLNEANKAFLFGINYYIVSGDTDYKEELESMFEITYHAPQNIETEAELFSTQLIFQYLFSQGRIDDARKFIQQQSEDLQEHRIVRNLLAMCYLYMNEYEIAREMFEDLLAEDNTDVHALCHYTLLLYNMNESEKYERYLQILRKVVPMNDDESFKLGIVLSYLKQYEASDQLLLPLYKKGKYLSIQMYHALSYNHYFQGDSEKSEFYWNKLREVSKVEPGYPPWMIEESKSQFNEDILPLLLSDDNHHRIYGIFLLNQLKGREILLTEEIWKILENMNDYEKLYLTYLIQDLKLTKLDFIHRGLGALYEHEELRDKEELFISWISRAESIIDTYETLPDCEPFVAATVYLFYKSEGYKITKRELIESFEITRYKLDKALETLLSI